MELLRPELKVPCYTRDDQEVWNSLFHRQWHLAQRHACREYLESFSHLGLSPDAIGDLDRLNHGLERHTGWRFIPVTEILEVRSFFEAIHRRHFPVTAVMRSPDEVDFSELPDIFHDLFGHGPLLYCPEVRALIEQFGRAAVRRMDDGVFLGRLAKLFWIAFEVGLIRQSGRVKIYGGAIISSAMEIANVYRDGEPRTPLSLASVLGAAYENTALQQQYFVIDRFSDLSAHVRRLEAIA